MLGARLWSEAEPARPGDHALVPRFIQKGGSTAEYRGFPIVTWNNGQLIELVSDYDTILTSYCLGDISIRVAGSLRLDQQLILDCYVPIYVEVCARDSADREREYNAFMTDMRYWNHTLSTRRLFPVCKRHKSGTIRECSRRWGESTPSLTEGTSFWRFPSAFTVRSRSPSNRPSEDYWVTTPCKGTLVRGNLSLV